MKLPQFLWPTQPCWDLQSSAWALSRHEWMRRTGRKPGNMMTAAICQDSGMMFISFIGLRLFEFYSKFSVSIITVITSSWRSTQWMWIGNFSTTSLLEVWCSKPQQPRYWELVRRVSGPTSSLPGSCSLTTAPGDAGALALWEALVHKTWRSDSEGGKDGGRGL